MVSIVKDWSQMEEYAEWCRIGQFQVCATLDGKEIRVLIGRFGFIRTFKTEEDPVLEHMLKFCKLNGFVEVVDNIPEDQFFKTAAPA
jgi:hypothetical protein